MSEIGVIKDLNSILDDVYGVGWGNKLVDLAADLSWFINKFPEMSLDEILLFAGNYPYLPENTENGEMVPSLEKAIKDFSKKANLVNDKGEPVTISQKYGINKGRTANTRGLLGNEPEANIYSGKLAESIKVGKGSIDIMELLKALEASKIKQKSKIVISKAKAFSLLNADVYTKAKEKLPKPKPEGEAKPSGRSKKVETEKKPEPAPTTTEVKREIEVPKKSTRGRKK